MDEEDFASLNLRPFSNADARRWEALSSRLTALGLGLWGGTAEDLQRQLEARHPRIPVGFELSEFRKLLEHIEMLPSPADPRFACLSSVQAFRGLDTTTVLVGGERLTLRQVRYEVVRRAIEYLEGR